MNRLGQRGNVVVILEIYLGSLGNEQGHNILVAHHRRVMQGRSAVVVPSVNVGGCLYQILDLLQIGFSGSLVNRHCTCRTSGHACGDQDEERQE